ncbi:MAG: agmatinase family protein [Saprospiraceae bacterium]|nr:agmatinase family protein [Saprospiraceae bacterium]
MNLSKEEKIKQFDPNGIGLRNNNFIGLPFSSEDAEVILLPVPWDVTVSFKEGTSTAPENIRHCSPQLDLYDYDVKNAWKIGIHLLPTNADILEKSEKYRKKAVEYIDFLENGGTLTNNKAMLQSLKEINEACSETKNWVAGESKNWLDKNRIVGVVGGDHSSPLGLIEALSERHKNFGILHIDAHMDLREAYEGFTYSHASIFYNALGYEAVSKLVSVGVRDFCEMEKNLVKQSDDRIKVFYDHKIQNAIFEGGSFSSIAKTIVKELPKKVYVSFDIDGLEPNMCPNTGTPVPGGLKIQEAFYLLNTLVNSGRKIIGFDLCEVAGEGNDWDGNVGARVLYKLCNLAAKSNDRH